MEFSRYMALYFSTSLVLFSNGINAQQTNASNNDTAESRAKAELIKCWELANVSAAGASARDSKAPQDDFTNYIVSKKSSGGFKPTEIAANVKIAYENPSYNIDSVRMFSYGMCLLQSSSLITNEKVIVKLKGVVENCQSKHSEQQEIIECNNAGIAKLFSE